MSAAQSFGGASFVWVKTCFAGINKLVHKALLVNFHRYAIDDCCSQYDTRLFIDLDTFVSSLLPP